MKANPKLIVSFMSAVMLAGCGGGASDQASSDTPLTGTFVDSAVAGVAYKTATQNGSTNQDGKYQYQAGETVTFSIGGVEFPPVTAKAVVTPFDMSATSAGQLNIAQLLQSLDEDGDPSNGIQIPESTHDALKEVSDIDFEKNDEASFKVQFGDADLDGDGEYDWKSRTEVKDHLTNVNGFVGSWMLASSDENGLVFLKLTADNQYVLLSDQEFTQDDVLQVGSYAIDSIDDTITFTKEIGNVSSSLESGLAYPVEVSDDLNELQITNDSGGESEFERVVSLTDQAKKPDAINGVWKFNFDDGTNKLAVFNKDNTYMVFSLEGNNAGSVVYEKGTYQITAEGGFSFAVTENGDGNKGFSSANPIGYSIEGATLTLSVSEGSITLTKILPFVLSSSVTITF
ncbi:hypothetical protein [Thiomicrorhabdus chilensis]|uniref:hypothetical protein n=1 Tax=Thiomicrorhabdus chilensis TaxID=63656 RepID=UPI000429A1C8|nr:hypothetical protein [Thiomicrorhabdus chilensis]